MLTVRDVPDHEAEALIFTVELASSVQVKFTDVLGGQDQILDIVVVQDLGPGVVLDRVVETDDRGMIGIDLDLETGPDMGADRIEIDEVAVSVGVSTGKGTEVGVETEEGPVMIKGDGTLEKEFETGVVIEVKNENESEIESDLRRK